MKLFFICILLLLSGCGSPDSDGSSAQDPSLPPRTTVTEFLLSSADGTDVYGNDFVSIDASNTSNGYVMIKYTGGQSRIKIQIAKSTTYTYDLNARDAYEVFPFTEGSGTYSIKIFENVSGNQYAQVMSQNVSVSLSDEFAPFLRPNQYVDYEHAVKTVAKAKELTAGKTETLDKVAVVYAFVIQNITYAKQLAATVQSGYLPVLDSVLEKKTGICFDYAALMTGMLRSQGVPCKLVVGYAGTAYHAWISVWSEKDGWIDGVVYFDGTSWQRMDPTFAANGKQSSEIMRYIGDGSNYTVKYLY